MFASVFPRLKLKKPTLQTIFSSTLSSRQCKRHGRVEASSPRYGDSLTVVTLATEEWAQLCGLTDAEFFLFNSADCDSLRWRRRLWLSQWR